MKHRTADLEGALLDAAVAKGLGMRYTSDVDQHVVIPHVPRLGQGTPLAFYSVCLAAPADGLGPIRIFCPSTDWAQGGQIIERERIHLMARAGRWEAAQHHGPGIGSGPTLLIAAMRAYVSSKFGDEVELHD